MSVKILKVTFIKTENPDRDLAQVRHANDHSLIALQSVSRVKTTKNQVSQLPKAIQSIDFQIQNATSILPDQPNRQKTLFSNQK